jgi:hypothetical protein
MANFIYKVLGAWNFLEVRSPGLRSEGLGYIRHVSIYLLRMIAIILYILSLYNSVYRFSNIISNYYLNNVIPRSIAHRGREEISQMKSTSCSRFTTLVTYFAVQMIPRRNQIHCFGPRSPNLNHVNSEWPANRMSPFRL